MNRKALLICLAAVLILAGGPVYPASAMEARELVNRLNELRDLYSAGIVDIEAYKKSVHDSVNSFLALDPAAGQAPGNRVKARTDPETGKKTFPIMFFNSTGEETRLLIGRGDPPAKGTTFHPDYDFVIKPHQGIKLFTEEGDYWYTPLNGNRPDFEENRFSVRAGNVVEFKGHLLVWSHAF